MAIDLQSMNVEDIIQMILAQKAQSPEARQPSRFDFAAKPPVTPENVNLPSRLDFANAAPAPVPTPRPEAPAPMPTPRPDPMVTGGIPTPTPAPREALAQLMQPPKLQGRAAEANYTTSGGNPIYRGGSSAIFGRRK